MASILARIFEHHRWANLRLIDVCAGLGEEQLTAPLSGTFGPIRDTLLHVVLNEMGYLAPFGVSPPDQTFRWGMEFPGFAALRDRADWTGRQFVALAAAGDEDVTLEGVHDGRPFALPRSLFLTQAINHATEHRTQVKTILTQLGIQPPELDGWTYNESP
jgi:uncharacterized damage-inducible protein DinB